MDKTKAATSSIMTRIRAEIHESCQVKAAFSDELLARIWQWANASRAALKRGKRIFFFGNGGSAADAQHMAAELVGRYIRERRPLPGVALTTNSSVVTAIGNDYGFEEIFSRQLEAQACPGDVVVGITTSGRSKNVLRAFEVARKKGTIAVALTGARGRSLNTLVDFLIDVPSENTQRIQESHIMIAHIYCGLVES